MWPRSRGVPSDPAAPRTKFPHTKGPTTMAKNRGASQRQLRVGELVRHALTTVLQRGEARDPLLQRTVISVSEVSMSPDLKIATAYVSALGMDDAAEQRVIRALADDAAHLRHRLTAHLDHMKTMPALRFRPDTSWENYAKVDALLARPQVRRDVESRDVDPSDIERGGDA